MNPINIKVPDPVRVLAYSEFESRSCSLVGKGPLTKPCQSKETSSQLLLQKVIQIAQFGQVVDRIVKDTLRARSTRLRGRLLLSLAGGAVAQRATRRVHTSALFPSRMPRMMPSAYCSTAAGHLRNRP
eukprot:6172821-Pleurochrysis_carterae.AAC.2